jgi:hypothetical protein
MTAAECSECGETIMGPDHPCFSKEDLVEELDELARMLRSLGATDTSEEPPSDARAGAKFNAGALDQSVSEDDTNHTEASTRGRSGPEDRLDIPSWLTSDLNPTPDPETHPCTPNEVSTTATPDTTDRPDAPDTKYGAVCPACDAPLDDVRDVLDGEPCPECGAHRSELYKLADQRGRGR